jgi:predicted phage tail protein
MAIEAKDNLNNHSYVNLIDVWGEGEIEGLATPAKNQSANAGVAIVEQLKDFFVNNTPVLREPATILAGTYVQASSKGIITGSSYSVDENLATITTAENHGLSEEDTVILTVLSGILESKEYVVEEKITSKIFTVINETGIQDGDPLTGLLNYTESADEITVTTTAAHGFKNKDKVVLTVGTGDAVTASVKINSVTGTTFKADSTNDSLTSGEVGVVKRSEYAYKDVEFTSRLGTEDQEPVIGYNQILSEQSVSAKIEKASPITRTLTNPNIDAARIRLQVQGLQVFQENGDIVGTSVKIRIEISENGGNFSLAIEDVIKGRTPDPYQRDYEVDLRSKTFPVAIRVTRVTKDSASAKKSNATSWVSLTSIIDARLKYPHTAYAAVRLSAQEFSSIPQRSYRIRGRKVVIPSNATVDNSNGRLIYSGTWDGTFATNKAWTSDPAWCLYDLLTDYRAGFGAQLSTSQLDKFSFFTASQYSSALVDDFKGGTEPRFSCNFNFNTQQGAYKAIADLCSVFRVMPFWAEGTMRISQDSPADPVYLFSLANVSPQGFTYMAQSQKTTPSVVLVSYFDKETREGAYEQVEDAAAIARYGIVSKEIEAIACTSRSQARRVGEWFLYTENEQTETVAFQTGIEAGILVRPGDVIEINDPVRSSTRRSGRIASATTTEITVDDSTGLPASGGSLSVLLPTGAVEKKGVTSQSSGVITVSSAYSAAPSENAMWLWEVTSSDTQKFQVLSVAEDADGVSYAISAIFHDPSKYAYIESSQTLEDNTFTELSDPPATPTGLTVTEALYTYQSEVRAKVILAWASVENAGSYLVRYAKDDDNFTEDTVSSTSYEILNITPGEFDVEVYALNGALIESNEPATETFNAQGKTAPPADVTGFTASLDPDGSVTLSWNEVADLDLQGYKIYQSPAYGTGTLVGVFLTTQAKLGQIVVAGSYTWTIKALDTSDNESANAASATVTAGEPGDFINVFSGDSTFANADPYVLTDYVAIDYIEEPLALIGGVVYIPIDAQDTWATHFSDQGYANFQAQIDAGYDKYLLPGLSTGTYTEIFDCGSTLSGVIAPTITTSAYSGTPVQTLLISTSLDNITYTEHTGLESVFAESFRYVKLAYTFTSAGNGDVAKITALNLKVSSKLKTFVGEFDSDGSAPSTIDVGTGFTSIKSVVVTPQGDGTKNFAVVDTVPTSGRFTSSVYDEGGTRRGAVKCTFIVQGT